MRKSWEFVPVVLLGVVGILTSIAGIVPGWDKLWWFLGAGAVAILGGILLYAREAETRRLRRGERREVETLQRQHRDELASLNEAHKSKIEELNTAHVTEVESLKNTHQERYGKLREITSRRAETIRVNCDRRIENLKALHSKELQRLLGFDLVNLLTVIGEVLPERDPVQRQVLASNARKTAVWCAAKLIGKTASVGTRANLFRLNSERTEMRLEPGAFAGRGDRSYRVFTNADDTFTQIMANDYVFVESVSEEEVQKQRPTRYSTYIAHPVSIGPDRIYGALTVDCPNAGDLDEDIDVPKLAVFANLIAATYEF